MRKKCLEMVYELAKINEKVSFIGSDLSPGLLKEMKRDYPNRFFMEGISEANIIGMAAGMAMEGYIPYVNTIATFITRRCYEQVLVDICLHNLPVRLIGNGGGYVYAPLGPTHQAMEDISIMRSIPNMTVVSVCDANEMSKLMIESLNWPLPIYIRLGKGGDPIVTNEKHDFKIGKAVDILQENYDDYDLLLITTGILVNLCIKASDVLKKQGFKIKILHFHTIKPLDTDALLNSLKISKYTLIVEEHSKIGGLNAAVFEEIIDNDFYPIPHIKRLSAKDDFSPHYGSQEELLENNGITIDNILRKFFEMKGGLDE